MTERKKDREGKQRDRENSWIKDRMQRGIDGTKRTNAYYTK